MSEITERLTPAIADRYRIDRELGQGGMAIVFLAHDMKHDRKVALKVLRPELAAVIGAERFLNEIKVTANLQHPHILPLHDSGEAEWATSVLVQEHQLDPPVLLLAFGGGVVTHGHALSQALRL